MSANLATPKTMVYPEDDGRPMSDNTLQWRWMVIIKENVEIIFLDDPHVFVAGNLLWYPVEGNPAIRQAPDILVALGRPKGDRGSYKQWEEGGIAPQVVFEVLSPGNRGGELIRKFLFYEKYGVEEYYIYDPDTNELTGWQRSGNQLREIPQMNGWTSPRLGIRFELGAEELAIFRPDGTRFVSPSEMAKQVEEAQLQIQDQAQLIERLKAQLQALGGQLPE
jgi:Uma2 family endonuclease